ncbi:hypothetical protein PVAP13_2NG425000 [Panicum virgatum]|uniref:Secreted protein n=1 Tax=Panicum virgatum TaxID=38727 RepID=A0A8T0VH93_PANVG|nr:hypothetical protein PVAP13_2NG425000 [Panicum virgatum]
MTFLCLSWIELELLALSVVLQAVSLASPDSSYLHATFIHVLNIAGGMSSLRKHIQSRATNTSYMLRKFGAAHEEALVPIEFHAVGGEANLERCLENLERPI